MPEIPDLNVFERNLTKRLVGLTLSEIRIIVPRKLKTPEGTFKDALDGHVLKAIKRVGKHLYFEFEGGHVLGLHLMLYGSMHWYEDVNENKFTIAELLFAEGTGLAITDWQKSVMLTLDPVIPKVPDAMELPTGYLHSALAKISKPIKVALTDAKVIQGIGNAYVDEILYAAKISPFSKADKIPINYIHSLEAAIGSVLVNAENHILKNFPNTITEKERDFLQVHRPKQSTTLRGEPILKAEIDKRKTYYTEGQKLFE